MATLIIGGTSGLGLEIGRQIAREGRTVIVSGRSKPDEKSVEFRRLDADGTHLPTRMRDFVQDLPQIDALVYSAGVYFPGTLTDLKDEEIEAMINVSGRGLIYAVRELLAQQGEIKSLVVITSSAQYTPRKLEPVYNFVKAGEAMLSAALAQDERIGKVLVAAPGGMQTRFWENIKRDDLATFLDPVWVAAQIVRLAQDAYKYRFVKILRDPPKVELVESH